ncbi:hypothetical protein [Aetokthonos hydrillicola]|uniref:hypothetical protein n=1 Tax=Aetokthonos hydrillicola TaxID=1550245 RepID=UPI001ABAF2D7
MGFQPSARNRAIALPQSINTNPLPKPSLLYRNISFTAIASQDRFILSTLLVAIALAITQIIIYSFEYILSSVCHE